MPRRSRLLAAACAAAVATGVFAGCRTLPVPSDPPGRTFATGSYRSRAAGDGDVRVAPRVWPGVHVTDPLVAHVLRLALAEAERWIATEECARLLDDYRDRAGIPLAERLRATGYTRSDYLGLLLFRDVPDMRWCVGVNVALTRPDSRLIFVCGQVVLTSWAANPRHVVAGVIHEALHSLGLPENPPSSSEITARILESCADSRVQ
jgi:hypothetical protein